MCNCRGSPTRRGNPRNHCWTLVPGARDLLEFFAFWGYGLATPILAAVGLAGGGAANPVWRRLLWTLLGLWIAVFLFTLMVTL